MILCGQCNATMSDSDQFCPGCGARTTAAATNTIIFACHHCKKANRAHGIPTDLHGSLNCAQCGAVVYDSKSAVPFTAICPTCKHPNYCVAPQDGKTDCVKCQGTLWTKGPAPVGQSATPHTGNHASTGSAPPSGSYYSGASGPPSSSNSRSAHQSSPSSTSAQYSPNYDSVPSPRPVPAPWGRGARAIPSAVAVVVVIGLGCFMLFGRGRGANSTYGSNHRGAYERQADEEIAKGQRDPTKSQSDKDADIILLNAMKTKARELDAQVAAMTPEQRDAFERTQRGMRTPTNSETNQALQHGGGTIPSDNPGDVLKHDYPAR